MLQPFLTTREPELADLAHYRHEATHFHYKILLLWSPKLLTCTLYYVTASCYVVGSCGMAGRRGRRQGGEINLSGLSDSLLKGIGVTSHIPHCRILTVTSTPLLTPQPPVPLLLLLSIPPPHHPSLPSRK